MSRINGYGITGTELQAMVNEHILLQKGSIPTTNRCLTNAEVYDGTHVYLGDAPSGTFIPMHNLGGATFGASPNWLANFTNINPLRSQSVLFEMDQVGQPYLNCDLFASVNGSPLHLDPGSNLDGLYFGGPQWSPQMNQYVKVGNNVVVQANYGRDDAESPGNWGWNTNGYGILEIWVNDQLTSRQYTPFRIASVSPNLGSLTYSFVVQPNTDYRVYAYSTTTHPDNILGDCNGQSTYYIGPWPDSAQYHDIYVGPGPAMVQIGGPRARKFYSPNTYPQGGTSSVNGYTNSWWLGHFTVGETDIVLEADGSSYYSGLAGNIVPDPTYSWTFIPAGEDSIKLSLYPGSPDSIFEISTYVGCAVPGTVTSLHWSPDNYANACNSNYNYHYFDGSENTIDGFTGFRDYLVMNGFANGGKISIYPSAINTISGAAMGLNGLRGYTYPDYANSAPGWSGSVSYSTLTPSFVNPGYFSDGTNWVQVGDSTSTTGFNDGVIINAGSCAVCKQYAITDYFLPA